MLVRVDVNTKMMGDPRAIAMVARGLLNGVVLANQILMHRYAFPKLLGSGIRYAPEPNEGAGEEEFATADVVLARGYGDCDDLAPYLCAELRGTRGLDEIVPRRLQRGENASIRVHYRPEKKLYHVLVRRGNGEIIDPSRYLGM